MRKWSILVVTLLLAACGDHPMDQGTVTGGDYQPMSVIPIPMTTCSGSPPTCITTTITQVVPEHWMLNLDDGTRKGAIEVDQSVYDRCLIGERYPLCGQDGTGDTRQ